MSSRRLGWLSGRLLLGIRSTGPMCVAAAAAVYHASCPTGDHHARGQTHCTANSLRTSPSVSAKAERTVDDVFKITGKCGSGGFGTVFRGVHRESGIQVAVKKIPLRGVSRSRLIQEVEILRVAGEHKSIVQLLDVFVTDTHLFVVMEFAAGGELFDRLIERGAYSEQQASAVLVNLGQAIAYLHQQGVVHADLKPENILLTGADSDDSDIRLIDFGSAFKIESERTPQPGSGTVAYSSPELLDGSGCDGKADMWAFGVIMYILLTGLHPFDLEMQADDDEIKRRILNGRLHFRRLHFLHISSSAKDLLKRLLSPDPADRPSAAEALNHSWLQGRETLSDLPLASFAENLRRFQRGRRRLKASLLAVVTGLLGSNQQPLDSVGSRAAALSVFDPDRKGFITAQDLSRVASQLGEKLSEREVHEMMSASDGDPSTHPEQISYENMIRVLPPLCRHRVYKRGDTIFDEGDVDPHFYLVRDGEMTLSLAGSSVSENDDGDDDDDDALQRLEKGQYFGQKELMQSDGDVLPRAETCRCTSQQCRVLSLGADLFHELTDVFEQVEHRLQLESEQRMRALIKHWVGKLPGEGEVTQRRLAPGDAVWQQNTAGDSFFVVLEGKVEITADEGGVCRWLAQIGDGDCFGEPILTFKSPGDSQRRTTCTAVTPVTLLEVPGKYFRQLQEKEVVRRYMTDRIDQRR